MEEFLKPRAQQILEERERHKQTAEQERLEALTRKTELLSKYEIALKDKKESLVAQTNFIEKVRDRVIPILQEIVDFAQKNSVYPRPTDRKINDHLDTPPIFPIRVFANKIKCPTFSSVSDLQDASEYKLQGAISDLSDENKKCVTKIGVEWGFNTSNTHSWEDGWGHTHNHTDYDIVMYGIQITILHTGEVSIKDQKFKPDEIGNKTFRQTLSDAFYSPVWIRQFDRDRLEAELAEVGLGEKGKKKSFWHRLWYGS